ncbi:MAG: GNAT family N-acetyltransferase [Candidatus Taylorbacteria bacterium]
MKDTSLVRVNMNTCPLETLLEWAECYCEIWKEPPWNEDFWQPQEVIKDFKGLMLKPGSAAFLAVQDGMIAGFTLGYSVNREELRVVAGNSMMDPLFVEYPRVFYIGELGVALRYRGQKISPPLTAALLNVAREFGLRAVVLRTHVKAYAARCVYKKLAFTELSVNDAKYPERTYWLLKC